MIDLISELTEELAILMGRKGNHQKALHLYTNTLKNHVLAEEFCKKVYQENPSPQNEVGRKKDKQICFGVFL